MNLPTNTTATTSPGSSLHDRLLAEADAVLDAAERSCTGEDRTVLAEVLGTAGVGRELDDVAFAELVNAA